MTQVVAEAKLVHIFLQVLPADAVKLPEHAALQQGPKPFYRVGVNIAIHIPFLVLDNGMGHHPGHAEIAFVFVRHQGGRLCVHPFPDKGPQVLTLHLVFLYGLRRDPAASLNGADNGGFPGAAPGFRLVVGVVVVFALAGLAADMGFVHLNDAGQQLALLCLGHGFTYLHGYPPGRVLVDFQISGKL